MFPARADTFTTVAEGCDLNPQGYFAHTVGFLMNPGVKVRLAKFEVCEPGSCFDAGRAGRPRRFGPKSGPTGGGARISSGDPLPLRAAS